MFFRPTFAVRKTFLKRKIMKNVCILLAALMGCFVLSASAQRQKVEKVIPRNLFSEQWHHYRYQSKGSLGILQRYFRDTVSVQEMKEAFRKYHAHRFTSSPYAGFDSIVYGFNDRSILLTSPLRDHPICKVRNLRGVWARGKRFHLQQLLDSNGQPQTELLKRVNGDTLPLMERTYVFLREPRHYMGFIVSPLPSADTFDKHSRVGTGGFNYRPLDFFCFKAPGFVLDGHWYHRIRSGARFFGRMVNLDFGNDGYSDIQNEHTFSVLLYEKPREARSAEGGYTLELLSPEQPDEETLNAFNRMKRYVEYLMPGTFNPLFTSDFRIMTGRYFLVTVDKCGWLIEDYLQ